MDKFENALWRIHARAERISTGEVVCTAVSAADYDLQVTETVLGITRCKWCDGVIRPEHETSAFDKAYHHQCAINRDAARVREWMR